MWDTVDAYGLPIDELAILWDRLIYPLYFPDRELSPLVKRACHAVSVDDERLTFHPVLWDEGCEAGLVAQGKVAADRIEQVWFSGVHSDVGGGYPKDPLALVALDWMISKVEASPTRPDGLHLIPARRQEFLQRSDWNGPQHDSRSGLGAYYRYKPRNIAQLCQDPVNGVRIDTPKIHRAVLERIRCGTIPYAPTGLPADYQVVTTRGSTPTYETPADAGERVQAMNAALDVVFWRRWLYGALVVLTLGLLLSPLYLPWERDGLCGGKACVLDPPLQLAKALLPSLAGAWFDALLQNPAWLGGFLGAFGVAFWLKSLAHRRTVGHAVAAWARLKRQGSVPQWRVSLIARIRGGANSPWRRLGKWLGAGGLMTLILALLLVALDRGVFHVRSTLGGLCGASKDGTTTTLSIDKPCLATGTRLSKGKRYRFEVALPAGNWQDGRNHSDKGPAGFEDNCMAPWIALRRHREEPWLKLMGRIGADGAEDFAIGAGPTEYRARSDGELFLYVNDAVFGLLPGSYWAWPCSWWLGPNEGKAQVTVTELAQDEGCPCQPGGGEPSPSPR